MTYEQFMEYRKLKSKKDKDEFYQKCVEENLRVRKRAKFVLDKDWLSVYDIRELLEYMKFNKLEKTNNRLENYNGITLPKSEKKKFRTLNGVFNQILHRIKNWNENQKNQLTF